MKHYRVAIIGAGTAGLSARREVAKQTDDYIVIDDGILGTTCARVGCMPSKVFIEVANRFHARKKMEEIGIQGSEALHLDGHIVMEHVRALRDRFVRSVNGSIDEWKSTHLLPKRARFINEHILQVGEEQIKADSIIIAAGSRPIIPKPWLEAKELLIDTNQIFELETLPKKMAIIGLGVIGLELGQALSRLGVEIIAIGRGKEIGGITDPTIQDYALEAFAEEFPLITSGVKEVHQIPEGLQIITDEGNFIVEKALVAVGRRPNVDNLGLENLSVERNAQGVPLYSFTTQKIRGSQNLYLAGDANADRPILHEAADEGRVAGYNAVRSEEHCFQKRTMLGITFSEPNLAFVGKRYWDLVNENIDFVTGKVTYEGQGRAIVKLQEKGLVHIYVDKHSAEILGAEIFAPQGEHLAHLLAWIIQMKVDIFASLSLPFYHPVLEEGLRTALRNAALKVKKQAPPLEIMRCQDSLQGT